MGLISGFVRIKAGTFMMGSPTSEAYRGSDEVHHEVTITRDFEMQVTTVTQLQWSIVMGDNPSYFKDGSISVNINDRSILMNPNRPVEQVSWFDVQKYIEKLNELDPSYNYRLPTEAEWEYAARAGTASAYSFGNSVELLPEYAWSYKNSNKRTHDVAKLKSNQSGLYDMYGNTLEWCQDWYGPLQVGSVTDPVGPSSGSYRVLRGGGWGNYPQGLRSAQRGNFGPGYRINGIGFRLVRTRSNLHSSL